MLFKSSTQGSLIDSSHLASPNSQKGQNERTVLIFILFQSWPDFCFSICTILRPFFLFFCQYVSVRPGTLPPVLAMLLIVSYTKLYSLLLQSHIPKFDRHKCPYMKYIIPYSFHKGLRGLSFYLEKGPKFLHHQSKKKPVTPEDKTIATPYFTPPLVQQNQEASRRGNFCLNSASSDQTLHTPHGIIYNTFVTPCPIIFHVKNYDPPVNMGLPFQRK